MPGQGGDGASECAGSAGLSPSFFIIGRWQSGPGPLTGRLVTHRHSGSSATLTVIPQLEIARMSLSYCGSAEVRSL